MKLSPRGLLRLNLHNADVVAPPPLCSKGGEAEGREGGCPPTSCSLSLFADVSSMIQRGKLDIYSVWRDDRLQRNEGPHIDEDEFNSRFLSLMNSSSISDSPQIPAIPCEITS